MEGLKLVPEVQGYGCYGPPAEGGAQDDGPVQIIRSRNQFGIYP
jgi:hypothetical protein